jgi:hypothetical protein
MFVEILDQLDEAVPVRDFFRRVFQQLPVVSVGRSVLRDAPDLEEASVVRKDATFRIDDQNSVERRFLLRFQNAVRSDGTPTSGSP